MPLTTMAKKIGGATVLAVVAATWAASAAIGSGASGALPDSLGACPGIAEPLDAMAQLTAPGAWVRVTRIDLSNAGDGLVTKPFSGGYTVVGGDTSFVDALGDPSVLSFHVPAANAVGHALDLGADVVAHTGADGDARSVAYAIAFKDGDFAFLGYCTADLFTKPIRAQLGSAQAVSALVGKSGAELTDVLSPPAPPAPPKVKREVILHPRTAPRSLLSTLDEAMFSVAAPPEQWRGNYTLCTRIAQGWNDCVDLSSVETATIPVHMYYDARNPVVEIWLLDHRANTEEPIARLGRVNVKTLAAHGKVDTANRGMRLGLTLSDAAGTPSLPDVVADRAKGPQAVKALRVTPLD